MSTLGLDLPTFIKYKVEHDEWYNLISVRSLALQPLSAENFTEFLQADNSKTIQ